MTSNERHHTELGEVRNSLSPSADLDAGSNTSDWIEDAGADPQADYEARQLNRAKAVDPLVGKVLFGTYQVIDLLGEGAMGVVYKARHLAFDRLVAMKTLKLDDSELLARFAREVKLHGALKHQNIVEAIDCLQAPNKRTFFVMELVEGVSLELLIRDKEKMLSEEDVFEISSQVASALGYAHQQGVIHRDLKPGNMIVSEKDGKIVVKVMDFGIAKLQESVQKLTKTGQAVGSPIYMSPEQCMGQDLDGRADIYSLGVMLYELVTGSVPFLGKNLLATMEIHCTPELHKFKPLSEYNLQLKGQEILQSIIERCLAIDPADRFPHCQDLRKALEFWYKSVSRSDGSVRFPAELAMPSKIVPGLSQQFRSAAASTDEAANVNRTKLPGQSVKQENAGWRQYSSSSALVSIGLGLLLGLAIIGVTFFFVTSRPSSSPESILNTAPNPKPSSSESGQTSAPPPNLKSVPAILPRQPSSKIQSGTSSNPGQSRISTRESLSTQESRRDARPRNKPISVRRTSPKPVSGKPPRNAKAEPPAGRRNGAEASDSNPFSRLRLQKD